MPQKNISACVIKNNSVMEKGQVTWRILSLHKPEAFKM